MKKLLIGLLMSGMLLGVFTVSALAEDKNASSEASITFTGGDTTPTDPKNPDNPDNPGTETGTGMNGPLSLDYVPTLNFGSNAITGSIKEFNSLNLKPYVQVTDKRGSGAGWKISVSLGEFTGANSSFDSAALVFSNSAYATTTGNNSGAPTSEASVVVESGAGETKLVGTVATGEGMGTWIVKWYPTAQATGDNDSLQLRVNTANVQADAYTAPVTWILSDAP